MENAVDIRNLHKSYASKKGASVNAIRGITLSAPKGHTVAIVGPDGAGKSTLLKLLCGLLEPESGTIRILGRDYSDDRLWIRSRIGYLSQKFSLYHDLTVDENIAFHAEIHRVKNFKNRREEMLNFTRLKQFRKRMAGKLSGGMKQKLALACTLIHTPDIIFLDEPTTGVDPLSRRDLWMMLSDVARNGVTFIVTTPYLDEAERCTSIVLLHQGKILAKGSREELQKQFPSSILEITAAHLRDTAHAAGSFLGKESVHLFGTKLHISLPQGMNIRTFKTRMKKAVGSITYTTREIEPSLEDIFIYLTMKNEKDDVNEN